MSLTASDLTNQEKLKAKLQADESAHKLENLAGALLGRLLGMPIAIAKSGFQHGGDGGPAGQQGRRFRLECKKYSDGTSLSHRELLGEIDHALGRDEALEAWFLIATRNVAEQLAQDLTQKGEKLGVPVVVIDWKDHELAPLAALCAFAPDLVEAVFSKDTGALARALQPVAADAIAALRRNLQSWCLGFEALRKQSHEKAEKIWNQPRASNAELGQNAAGGAQPHKVKRQSVHDELTAWWRGPAQNDSPTAILGWDGVGKTWAALHWLIEGLAAQPILLVVPSAALASLSGVSEVAVKHFLAGRLYEITGVRHPDHWLRRLDYLFKRPISEGPVLTLFFDGMNQEPSVPWLTLLKVLQGDAFAGQVRVMTSTRNHHFEDKLSGLRGLVVPAAIISVAVYDAAPGGELDQMLAFEGLTQADLHPDLVELARTPRLFKLVIRFRDKLVEAGQVTIHRLLWEYGRDTFGERAGKSFSESEWREWLGEIARRYRDGVQEFSLRTLGETASRPDLSEKEVYARLSDIIDGQFARAGPSGSMQLTPTVVAHALGAALLAHLDSLSAASGAALDAEVTQWIDPIAGLDQRAEILRAAVSILVERGNATATPAAGVLVTAWLQTQNVTDGHRRELAILAPHIPDALLDAVEQSDPHTHSSARLWAVNALRAIPRTEGPPLTAIVARVRSWYSVVSREVDNRADANPDFEKRRAERYRARIGVDASGPLTVLGLALQLVDRADGNLPATAPSILEGFPLTKLLPCFEAAAVAGAVRGHADGWEGLKWLCRLNEVDPQETAEALSALAAAVHARTPEAGVHAGLPARAAALLLWSSGREADEELAVSIDPRIDHIHTYENDYLANPSRSYYALERRHTDFALSDTGLPIRSRLQRTKELWLDPTFQPPPLFVEELRVAAAEFSVEKLDRQMGHTQEDYLFEDLEPVLARCAPDLLAALVRRKLQGFVSCPADSRYWSAIRATEHLILAGDAAASAQALRLSARDKDDGQEAYAASQLFLIELPGLDTQTQFDRLIAADLKFVPTDLAEVLRAPTTADVDALLGRYRGASAKQKHDLIVLLSIHPVAFSDDAWAWLSDLARQPGHELRGVLFRTLARADAARFGRILAAENWSWEPKADLWVNHYGTGALLKAEPALPFDQLAPRLAPSRLLEAARVRGADPAEVRLAAEIFGHVLAAAKIEAPDPGSIITVEREQKDFTPFIVSISPRPRPEEQRNPLAALRAAIDTEARHNAHQRAIDTAVVRIEDARKSGASLYLTNVDPEDMKPVLQHASDMADRWLEGSRERTRDFQRRVRLAEAAFLALCEALLAHDPARGVELWRALRATLATRYIGAAGVDDLLHIAFQAPDSAPVTSLRDELISLPRTHTDLGLFDVALAATYNGKFAWLAAIIAADQASPLMWRQKRATVLSGFTVNNTLPVPEAWPEGQILTSNGELRRKAAGFRLIDACAHHWWRAYLTAQDPVQAYAAWILFLRSADRRAWTWMREEVRAQNNKKDFFELKLRHAEINRSTLKRAMEKRLDKPEKKFLDEDIVDGIGPWGKEAEDEYTTH
jgi:hypothetical protein